MGRWLLFIVMLFFSGSCTEKVDWNLEYQDIDLIVVEGKITDEQRAHEVRLSYPVYERNGIPEPVTGALVEINDGRVIHPLTEDISRPGIYLTDTGFAGEIGRGYQLRIRNRDRRISAVAFIGCSAD